MEGMLVTGRWILAGVYHGGEHFAKQKAPLFVCGQTTAMRSVIPVTIPQVT